MLSMFKLKKFKRMGEYPRITEDYIRYRQEDPNKFVEGSFRTVPLSHTQEFKDKHNFKGYDVKDLKAITGKLKVIGRWKLQSILIPKEPKRR